MAPDTQNQKLQTTGFMFSKAHEDFDQEMYGNFSLDAIIAGSDIAVWALDPGTMRVNACPTFKSLLNLPKQKDYLFTGLFRMIDQSSRDSFIKEIKKSCSSLSAFSVEFKSTCQQTNEARWYKLSGKASGSNPDGHNLYMGTLIDITEAKIKEIWNNDRLALLSHELKGPLSVIKLYLQRAGKIAGEKKVRDAEVFLNKADEQVMAMAGMMDDFLSFSTAGNATMKLCCEPFNMLTLVEEVLAQMRLKHPEYNFSAVVPSSINIRADMRKITQVLMNYLSNAVKYSPENTAIEVRCKAGNGQTILSVTDHGIGIDETLQNKVFERYYRTPGTKADGFGLGLYLVKEIVNSHSGNVWVTSKVNKGSSFYFSIPSSANHAKMDAR